MAQLAPSVRAAFLKGLEEFNTGLFFECHETLEEIWRAEKGHRRDFYKGIIQVAAGLHHLTRRRNFRGTIHLLERGLARLETYPPRFLGVDVEGLRAGARRLRDEVLAQGGAIPPATADLRLRGSPGQGGSGTMGGEERFLGVDRSFLPKIVYEEPVPALRVKRLRSGARLPQRATPGSSGLDLYACLEGSQSLSLGRDPTLVPTGVAIEIPPGYEGQVRPRSGLSAQGVGVTFGTIDSDYRGEVLVTMHLFGSRESYAVQDGDRIAQLVIAPVVALPVEEAEELSPTERGAGGHGSTGP